MSKPKKQSSLKSVDDVNPPHEEIWTRVDHLSPGLSASARTFLNRMISLRLVDESSRERLRDELFAGWPRVADCDDAQRGALTELLAEGWLEVRHDGGFLSPEVGEPNSTVIPGWRLESVAFQDFHRVLSGLCAVNTQHRMEDLVLPSLIEDLLMAAVAGTGAELPMVMALIGEVGSGKTAVAHALAGALDRKILSLSPTTLADPRRSTAKNIQILNQTARDHAALVLLERGELFFPLPSPDSISMAAWHALLDEPPELLVVTAQNADWLHPRLGRRADSVISLGGLRGKERIALWERLLADRDIDQDINLERMATRYDLLPGALKNAINMAERRSRARGEGGRLSAEDLEAGALLQVRHKLDTMAQQVWARLSLDDLILDEDTLGTVQDIIEAARVRETVFDEWGFAAKNNRGRGLSILFDGEPGTGKTLCAEVLAAEMGLPLYRVSMANIMSKYVGETEKNLQKIFDEARGSRSILLFDEADALFSQRVEVKGANDRFANMEVNVLLQLMEGHDGICVLTTNLKKGIDKAFERRLTFKLHFPFPDEETREKLWLHHLPDAAPVSDDVDEYILSRSFELSGGSIRNAVVRAAYKAAARGVSIGQAGLIEGAKAECVAAGKLYRLITDDD
jgi:SpoVK/Ycf46/Vps4 family AAA+-type ATPase